MLAFWIALLAFLPATISAPVTGSTKSAECTNPVVRREWRTLSQDQRNKFHKAIKCLQDKPSTLDVEESKNLFDDFGYVHYTINRTIHHVASFFPWHRYFIILREQALSECGYSDPMPYWDWTLDSTTEGFQKSEMFDNEKGFGGNGTGKTDWVDGSCVEDGPYAGLQVNYPEPHCLTRRFNFTGNPVGNWTKSVLNEIMQYPDYINFWNKPVLNWHSITRLMGFISQSTVQYLRARNGSTARHWVQVISIKLHQSSCAPEQITNNRFWSRMCLA